jgi:arylsulfatase A-like enzyme
MLRASRGGIWLAATAVSVAAVLLAATANNAHVPSSDLSLRILTDVAVATLALGLIRAFDRRRTLRRVATAAALVAVTVAARSVDRPARPPAAPLLGRGPNVVLITLDTVRADHLSLHGYARPTTPSLERLARDADVFRHAISPATWTVPAHASLLTGLLPTEHGARIVRGADGAHRVGGIDPTIATLAELLRAGGYATAAFASNAMGLAPGFGFARGFDVYDATPRSLYLLRPSTGALVAAVMPREYAAFIRPFRTGAEINGAALRWIDERADAPFFAFLNYMEAHYPYDVRSPYGDGAPGLLAVHEDWRDPWSWYRRLARAVEARTHAVDAAERRHLEASYDAALTLLDHHVGDLLDALRARDLYDDALVIVTSDHGELFGEHGLLQHKVDPYEGVTHVPLLVKPPRHAGRRVVTDPVSTRIVFSEILDAAGIAVPAGRPRRPDVISEHEGPHGPLHKAARHRVRCAAYRGRKKVTWSSDGDHAIYRLGDDPRETRNLYRPATTAPLLAALAARYDAAAAAPPALADEATLGRLRALGYLR